MTENTMLSRREIAELYPTDDDDRKHDSLYMDVAKRAVNVAVATDAWGKQYVVSDEDLTRSFVLETLSSMDNATLMGAYSVMYRAYSEDARNGDTVELNRLHNLAQTNTTKRG